jgi:hypothetical protein
VGGDDRIFAGGTDAGREFGNDQRNTDDGGQQQLHSNADGFGIADGNGELHDCGEHSAAADHDFVDYQCNGGNGVFASVRGERWKRELFMVVDGGRERADDAWADAF